MADDRRLVPVAVGVLVRHDGAVLLAGRPAGKPYSGYWEFPGGKIEAGESPAQALERELREELGIAIAGSTAWTSIEHHYPHAHVRLYFRRVFEWSGTPQPLEGQRLQYFTPGAVPPAPLLPAALPAMRWIELPTVMAACAGADAADPPAWTARLAERGARQLLWPAAAPVDSAAAAQCYRAMRAWGVRLILPWNGPPTPCPQAGPGHGVFLTRAALHASTARPAADWLGAEVESPEDLAQAARLGCDFAIRAAHGLDPSALATAQGGTIATCCTDPPLPVYLAVDTPSPEMLEQAQSLGAHGLVPKY